MYVFRNYLLKVLILVFGLAACEKEELCSQNKGQIITEIIDIPAFNGVDLKMSGEVVLSQGITQEVRVTSNVAIIDALKTSVDNGVWRIDKKGNCNTYNLKVHITLPNIDKVYISGSGSIIVNDFKDQNDMTLKISGSGNMKLNKISGCEYLTVKISGSGDVNVLGVFQPLENVNISMSGSGTFKGFNVSTNTCFVSNSGSGSNEISVTDYLKVSLSGSGSTYYKGFPNIEKSISGSGSVISVN